MRLSGSTFTQRIVLLATAAVTVALGITVTPGLLAASAHHTLLIAAAGAVTPAPHAPTPLPTHGVVPDTEEWH